LFTEESVLVHPHHPVCSGMSSTPQLKTSLSQGSLPESIGSSADVVTNPSLFPASPSAAYQCLPTLPASLLSHKQNARHLDAFLLELVEHRDAALTVLSDLSAPEQAVLGAVNAYVSQLRALCLEWKDQQVRLESVTLRLDHRP
jgi:hypothetical protein